MADEDLSTTGAAADSAGDDDVSGLPSYVDAIIQGYGQQFGRVISRKIVKAKDPEKDRDRLIVTYENGQSQRKAVTFRIGQAAVAPSSINPSGTPAETTIVESVEDAKAPAKPGETRAPQHLMQPDGKVHIMGWNPATNKYDVDQGIAASQPSNGEARPPQHIQMPDGKVHVMGWNPQTGKYDQDQGLAPPTGPAAKPPPSDATKWQPLKGPDGKVVALVDPATGDTVSVTQRDPKTYETKDGRIISISDDGRSARDITPEGPGDKIAPPGLEYTPDYNQDDGGLTDYNKKLKEAQRTGQINREQGLKLLQEAGALWEATATHGKTLRDQAGTQQGRDITQRGQDLGEVESRRTAANGQFRDIGTQVDKLAEGLITADGATGQTVVDAYRAMLRTARRNAEDAGGMQDVPQVATPDILRAPPGSESTQVVMHPGGRIEVSPPGAAPPEPAGPISDPRDAGGVPPSVNAGQSTVAAPQEAVPVNPAVGEPGNDPTKPVGMSDDADVQHLVAQGFDPAEAQQIAALYRRGVREEHL